MTKFLIIYHAPAELMAKMGTATPEEKEAGMKAWMDWKAANESAILDFGAPLMPGTKVDRDGNEEKTFTDTTGYSLLQGNSEEEIRNMVKSHPHLHWGDGCAITVHECINM